MTERSRRVPFDTKPPPSEFDPMTVRILAVLLGVVLVLCPLLAQAQPADTSWAYANERHAMVAEQIEARGISNPDVLSALRRVPRHRLVPNAPPELAYSDRPLPIGHDQTISQPFVVATMTQFAEPEATDRALEIGTGSGYQAAVLAEIVDTVYTIEIVPELARTARERLHRLGYDNVVVRAGDGYKGWPEHAPFDLILVTAAPDTIPPPLIEQLAVGGRLVAPVGPQDAVQQLTVVTKDADGIQRKEVMPVRFVPFHRK